MAKSQGNKDSAMSAHLKASGYPHGRRKSGPNADSGGLTMTRTAGSTNHKKRMNKEGK